MLAFSPLILFSASAFQPPIVFPTSKGSNRIQQLLNSKISATEEARNLKEQAERARVEAQELDARLTKSKILDIEKKMENTRWTQQNPKEAQILEEKLEGLRQKSVLSPSIAPPTLSPVNETSSASSKGGLSDIDDNKNPLSGFDESELILYLPTVKRIEAEAPENVTTKELIEQFQSAPELKEHFQRKIQEMLVIPMEEMQQLEELESKYLSSSSALEKAQLKREIERARNALKEGGPFDYSENIFLDIPPMDAIEMEQRLEAVGSLPTLLQAVYKMRCEVDVNADITLAILKDHFDLQLQLLLQVKDILPLDQELKSETRKAIDSLPEMVRTDLCERLGVEGEEALFQALTDGGSEEMSSSRSELRTIIRSAGKVTDIAQYDDIDFVDRSRYLQEFFPSIAAMESQRPTLEDVVCFADKVVDKETFMQTGPPEAALGCFYIRGQNQLSDDPDGVELMRLIQEKHEKSSVGKGLEFFYVPDPSPLTDEAMEMGESEEPIIIVTRKNWDVLYDSANPLTKLSISALGFLSMLIFAVASCDYQPGLEGQLDALLDGREANIDQISEIVWSVASSLGVIHVFHEVGHQLVGLRDKFRVGLPTFLPSLQLGLFGSITPILSPPPNFRSLFDFAVAGPLLGLIASLTFLAHGLFLTASTPLTDLAMLPALPTMILRASTLGGEMVETFLGPETLLVSDTVSLHPEAIAGFSGLVANALALLPTGNSDGGRISLALFGRRGAFILKAFTIILLCLFGLFGFDETNILLFYALLCVVWQRDLEKPIKNEFDELDLGRGGLAIAMGFIAALTLSPMI